MVEVGALMPMYRSHKTVRALKIEKLVINADSGAATITPSDKRHGSFEVDAQYVNKHQPKDGGYFVVYNDGYKSWSPGDVFESGYTLVE